MKTLIKIKACHIRLCLTKFSILWLTLLSHYSVNAADISIEKMTADVTFLSSDKLQGRANFSKEIEQAADYISHRFSDIGLIPLEKQKSFRQTFTISNFVPTELTAVINGTTISENNLTLASTIDVISWQNTDKIKVSFVSSTGDIRTTLRHLNKIGGKHLVLINIVHAEIFERYRRFFQRGITKLYLQQRHAIIMVLSNETTINTIDIKATTSVSKRTLSNVVGILPGKSKPDEIILFSAHYDHLGVKSVGDGDLIYNGADDDASGVTAVIHLAEYFSSKANNSRTLMFAAFTAEEIGGFGSRYFSEQLNPQNVVAMINIEMIGKPSIFGEGALWMTGMERSNLGAILNKDLMIHQLEIHQDPYPEQRLFYRSDNATLARLGVPAHSFSSTQLDKDIHYHQTSDEISHLNLTSMHKVIETLAMATQGLVDGRTTPTRIDATKVKARGKIF